MKSVISQKGQVTIPKSLRIKLGLRPGTVLDFEAVEGKLVAVKRGPQDPFSEWLGKGRLPGGMDVDAYLKTVRG